MIKNYVKNIRRYLHMYPEISMNEYKTTIKICKELNSMNINFYTIQNGRGVIAKITGKNTTNTLALRCEIDALPINEENNISYKSKNKKAMHACGHDANMAIVLGAIKILKDKTLDKDVYFIFQTDEEIARGAINYKKEKFYKDIKNMISIHTNPNIKSGDFFIKEGNIIAGVERFVVNCTKISKENIKNKLLLYEYGNFYDDAYIKIKFSKIIDNKLIGSIHYFDKEKLYNIKKQLSKTIDVNFIQLTLPVINDSTLYDKSMQVLSLMNLNNSYTNYIHGGEDFSYYLQEKKGMYIFLGVRDEKKGFVNELHSPSFDLDDSILYLGSLFCSKLIEII